MNTTLLMIFSFLIYMPVFFVLILIGSTYEIAFAATLGITLPISVICWLKCFKKWEEEPQLNGSVKHE